MDSFKSLSSCKTIAIKAADKRSSVVVWCLSDYLQEASTQLQDKNFYEEVRFSENMTEAIRSLNVCEVTN